jgi:hypothetical protein
MNANTLVDDDEPDVADLFRQAVAARPARMPSVSRAQAERGTNAGCVGVGSSAWFGVQGGRFQRAVLLPSGCFSLYASYFPVE